MERRDQISQHDTTWRSQVQKLTNQASFSQPCHLCNALAIFLEREIAVLFKEAPQRSIFVSLYESDLIQRQIMSDVGLRVPA